MANEIKNINGLVIASIKTVNGLAVASVKKTNGLLLELQSEDGKYQSAYNNSDNKLYYSSDYGVNWSSGSAGDSSLQIRSMIFFDSSSSGIGVNGTGHVISINQSGGQSDKSSDLLGESLSAVTEGYNGYLFVSCQNGTYGIYKSTDTGTSWTGIKSSGSFTSISASSKTSQYLTVLSNSLDSASGIYVSTDYGQNWTQFYSNSNLDFRAIAISHTGQYQTAVTYGEYIYRSSNYGASWAAVTGAGTLNGWGVAISQSGQYQTLITYGGSAYYSSNYGVNWSTCTGVSGYSSKVQMCASGQYQIISRGGALLVSSDYGANWTSKYGTGSWMGVTINRLLV